MSLWMYVTESRKAFFGNATFELDYYYQHPIQNNNTVSGAALDFDVKNFIWENGKVQWSDYTSNGRGYFKYSGY